MNRRTAAETLGLLAAPAVAFWLIHFVPIAQNSGIDPYIYTGYIHNFVDLFDRYRATYYGVRFGLILPAQLTATLFGPIAGYFVLRYLLVLIAGVPFYLLVKQRYGVLLAWTTFFLWVTSPFLARTVLWDHPDASGVMFLFAAICLFSIEHQRRRHLLDAGAGICAGMAIHSNIFTLAPMSIYFASYTAVWWWWGRGLTAILRQLLVIVAAVAAVSAFGAVYYWWKVGRADIFTITLNVAQILAAGGMEQYRTPGIAWVAKQWWSLTPAFLLVLMTLVYLRRRDSFHDALVWTGLAGTVAFFAISQFFLHADFLELPYYFSYTLPIAFLSLASIVACLWRWDDPRTRGVSAVLLLTAALGPWVMRSFGIRYLVHNIFAVHLAIVAVAVTLVAIAFRFRRPALSVMASVALGVMFYSSFAWGPHANMVSNRLRPNRVEMDVYRVALEFIRNVPPIAERPGEIRFWYPNGPTGSLQGIQSTYLWGYSKVQGEDPDRGLPYLGTSEVKSILEPDVKWLGMLAEKDSQLTLGREALREHDISGRTVSHRVLTAGGYTMYFELLEILREAPRGVTYDAPIIAVTDRTPPDVNVYGTPRGQLATVGTRVTFTPTDMRDHVAYPFVALSPRTSDTWARVTVESSAANRPSCLLLVQNQGFDSLAKLGCSSTTQDLVVPATTQKIRVTLTDLEVKPFVLPRKIEVALGERK